MPARRDRLFRLGLICLSTLALATPSPAAAQVSDAQTYRVFPYLTPAGDLTGDGLADTLTNETTYENQVDGVASLFPTPSIAARRGLDGSALWQRDIRAHALLPAPLGPGAGPGILAVDENYTGSQGGGGSIEFITAFGDRVQAGTLILTALDGNGEPLWERSFDPGAFAGAALFTEPEGRRQVIAVKQFPLFVGLIQATPSPAMDALVTILDRTEVNDQIETTLTVVVVDGASGDLALQEALVTSGTRPAALVTGDLDGDRLDDLLVARYPGAGEITALRGSDGQILWTNDDDVVPFEVFADDLGDVTGDGIDDVTVRGFGDVFSEEPPRVTVLDGGTGSVLFGTIADTISAVGTLANGASGLLALHYDSLETEVEYRLFAPDGTVVRERYVLVPEDDENTYVTLIPNAGDVDGDGLADAGHVVSRLGEEFIAAEERTIVSTATLTKLFDADAGIPLLASLDGGGDDLLAVERTSASGISVVARDGSGDDFWSRTLPVDPDYPGLGRVSVTPADVDGDQIPDVILNAEISRRVETTGGSSSEYVRQAWVLRGTDGSTLWSA